MNGPLTGFLQSLWYEGRGVWPASESEWQEYCRRADRHGLAGLLYHELPGAPENTRRWARDEYLKAAVANRQAIRQVEELAGAFHAERIPFLLLKGCAALLFLYRDAAWRQVRDIDVLVKEQFVAPAARVMRQLGYAKFEVPGFSPEDDRAEFRNGHLPPFLRNHDLPVEIHGSIFYRRGRYPDAAEALWRDSVPLDCRGAPLRALAPAHFLIHLAVHSAKHLRSHHSYPFKLKDAADSVLLLDRFRDAIDWPAFSRQTRRWGLENEVGTLLSTLNCHWKVNAPLSGRMSRRPLSLRLLVEGPPRLSEERRLLRGYAERLADVRTISGARNRIGYCFRLLIPAFSAGNPGRLLHILRRLSRAAIRLALGRQTSPPVA